MLVQVQASLTSGHISSCTLFRSNAWQAACYFFLLLVQQISYVSFVALVILVNKKDFVARPGSLRSQCRPEAEVLRSLFVCPACAVCPQEYCAYVVHMLCTFFVHILCISVHRMTVHCKAICHTTWQASTQYDRIKSLHYSERSSRLWWQERFRVHRRAESHKCVLEAQLVLQCQSFYCTTAPYVPRCGAWCGACAVPESFVPTAKGSVLEASVWM